MRQITWGTVPTSVNTEGYECTSSALESKGSVLKENDFLRGKGCGRWVDPKGRGRGVKESRERGGSGKGDPGTVNSRGGGSEFGNCKSF